LIICRGAYLCYMIRLTKFNGEEFFLNVDQIMVIENIGDTIVVCNNGSRIRVKEKPDDITRLALEWQQASWLPLVHNVS